MGDRHKEYIIHVLFGLLLNKYLFMGSWNEIRNTKTLSVLVPEVRYHFRSSLPVHLVTSGVAGSDVITSGVKPEVVLMGQLCPGKAISHFSGYIGKELNAERHSCETGAEDFRRTRRSLQPPRLNEEERT